MLLLLYVDNMLLAYTPTAAKKADEIKQASAATYKITSLRTARQFLEIKFYSNSNTMSLGHGVFIDSMLKSFHLETANAAATPLDDNVKLDLAEEQEDGEVDPKSYQGMVGSLMFIALATRLDITFAVAELDRYNSWPFIQHLTPAQYVLQYLIVTNDNHLHYNATSANTLIS